MMSAGRKPLGLRDLQSDLSRHESRADWGSAAKTTRLLALKYIQIGKHLEAKEQFLNILQWLKQKKIREEDQDLVQMAENFRYVAYFFNRTSVQGTRYFEHGIFCRQIFGRLLLEPG